MFVGRERELAELESLYQSDVFQCVIVWGRRRVGKTTLLREFARGKDVIHFTAIQTNAAESLESLSRAILAPAGGPGTPVFPDWKAAFDHLGALSKSRRLAVVIDEYPYLAQSFTPVSTLLQSYIDGVFKNGRLFLVLCGSSMSFMEHQVLGYQSPLYGRRTAQFKLEPFSFAETARYFPRMSDENLVAVHGITGGVPLYLEKMDESLSLKANVIRNLLTPSAYLFEEPLNLLKQEVRDPGLYNAVLQAVAEGRSRVNEIATKVGLETSACTQYLKNLIELGILRREQPVFEASSRKSIYYVSDSLFRFWYRFVVPNLSMIQNGLAAAVWSGIEELFPAYLGREFEEICRQYLWMQNAAGALPLQFVQIGRWWGNDPLLKTEAEIDLVAADKDRNILFGECKWTTKAVDLPVLQTLTDRARLLPHKKAWYILFSKAGFTKRCQDAARARDDVILIGFKELVQASRQRYAR